MSDTSCSLSVGRPQWIPTDYICEQAREMASDSALHIKVWLPIVVRYTDIENL